MSLFQIPKLLSTSQKLFILKEILKLGKCFIPHPPREIGRASDFQSARWNFLKFAEDPHQKLKMIFLSLSRIVAGIGKRDNQYTGMLERTDLECWKWIFYSDWCGSCGWIGLKFHSAC